jgi:hypothetical protein
VFSSDGKTTGIPASRTLRRPDLQEKPFPGFLRDIRGKNMKKQEECLRFFLSRVY